jgi:solute carrier family 35 (UDP-xylose/UDP-N-acetylglucosamine transporter), member B4
MGGSASADIKDFNAGLIILFVAQLLSAIMGVYVQETYAIYGSHWRENLFYSHFLSLPLFSPILPSLYGQYQRLVDSPPISLTLPSLNLQQGLLPQLRSLWGKSFILASGSKAQQLALITLPKHVYTLFLNALTQYACIRGVNLLGARTTALGVTIVLNLRKLVSLFASIWLFGNELPFGVMVGAAIVFSGASVYAWGGSAKSKQGAPSKKAKPKAA